MTEIKYDRDTAGKWQRTDSIIIGGEATPLKTAVTLFATDHPGKIVIGVAVDDDVKHVGLLEDAK